MKIEVDDVKSSDSLKAGDLIYYKSNYSGNIYYLVIQNNNILGLNGLDKFKVFDRIDFDYVKVLPGSKVVLTVE